MANFVVASAQAPMTVAPQAPLPGEKYKKAYKVVGICQVIVGSLAVILAIVNLGIESSSGNWYRTFGLTIVSAGIWTGVLAFTAGVLGIVSGANPEPCRVNGGMVVSIFAAIAAGLMFSIETPAAVYASGGRVYYSYTSTAAIHGILSFLAFAELVLAIVHSAYCCAAGCCHTYTGHVVGPSHTVITTTTYPNQIPVTALPGQQIQYVQQPVGYVQVPNPVMHQQQPYMTQPPIAPSQRMPQQQAGYVSMPTNEAPPQYSEKAAY